MNLLHDIFLKSHVPEIVIDRMSEITDILDSNYGIQRSSTAMGGYLLFFPPDLLACGRQWPACKGLA